MSRAPATSGCTAIVSDGTLTWSAHSDDFGQSWQQEGGLPALFLPANSLTCSAGGSCLVAGYVPTGNSHGEGAVALSTDGGKTWALATVPAGVGLLQSASCLTASECVAAGTTNTTVSDVVPAKGQLLLSADGGHTWQLSSRPVPVDDVFGVACPSATQCAMVGTKWVGFPAVATGCGGPEPQPGRDLPSLDDGLHPHHADRTVLPDELRLRGGRWGHRGPSDPPGTQTGPGKVPIARVSAPVAQPGATAVTKAAADRLRQ